MPPGDWTRPPAREDYEPRYACLSCLDETHGWRPFWCPGVAPMRDMVRPERVMAALVDCGRQQPHRPHAYVARCECWPQNPIAAARRERELIRFRHSADRRRTA